MCTDEGNTGVVETAKTENTSENKAGFIWGVLITSAFFAFILVSLVLRIVLPTSEFSYAENRKLAEMPEASLDSILFGEYTQQFDDYFADTFPLRDTFMRADSYVSYMYKIPLVGVDTFIVMEDNEMQMELDDENVYFEDDYEEDTVEETIPATAQLPDNINIGEQMKSDGIPTPEPIPELPEQEMLAKGKYLMTDTAIYQQIYLNSDAYTNWAEGIKRLQEELPERRVMVMSPPGSFAFYAQDQYCSSETDQISGVQGFYSKFDNGVLCIDMIPQLMLHRDEYIYFRTDHHWTGLGAYYAYVAFCDAISLTPQDITLMEKREYEKDFLGSYYKTLKKTAKAKIIMNSPDRVEYFVPPYECEVLMYKYAMKRKGTQVPMFDMDIPSASTNYYRVFLGGDYPCLKLTSNIKNGKSILVLKDSYGNAFIPYLTANYETVYVIDFRDFNTKDRPKLKIKDFIEEHDIEDVLCVMYFGYANNSSRVKWFLRILPKES